MVHSITYVIFIVLFTYWLGHELNRTYTFKKYWKWILAAVLTGIVGTVIYNEFLPDKLGNFILHASGGVSSVFLFIYFTKTLKIDFLNWRLTTLILFAFVTTLGVLNELAEYFFEFLGLGPFSFDSHDTWRDFVANTTGAIITWVIWLIFSRHDTN